MFAHSVHAYVERAWVFVTLAQDRLGRIAAYAIATNIVRAVVSIVTIHWDLAADHVLEFAPCGPSCRLRGVCALGEGARITVVLAMHSPLPPYAGAVPAIIAIRAGVAVFAGTESIGMAALPMIFVTVVYAVVPCASIPVAAPQTSIKGVAALRRLRRIHRGFGSSVVRRWISRILGGE